jgi:hypothetical protein
MYKRYRGANKKERGALLDEMEQVTELDPRTLIRRMNGETWDHITAERLTPSLVWMAERLAHLDEIAVDFFQAVMRLAEKIVVHDEQGKHRCGATTTRHVRSLIACVPPPFSLAPSRRN